MALKNKSKRIFYFDALRALAIICVILIHIYTFTRGHVVGDYPNISFEWIFTQIIGNPFRIGVDLFLMLSGALSLGREWDIKTFLGKRIPRIVTPFIFWNVVLIILFSYLSYIGRFNFVHSFDINSLANYVISAFLGKTVGFAPNWFFWMILGTYLFMPIINKWLLHSDLAEAEYFLVFWLITTLFSNTLNTAFPIKLSYFTSPIGLVVLGYYLRNTERKIFKNKYFVLFLIIVPAILLVVQSYFLSSPLHMRNVNRYSLFVCLEVIGVFLLFRNTNFNINQNGITYKIIFALAKYSYGIYLFHYAVIIIIVRRLHYFYQPGYMILIFILVVAISLVIMSALNRIPYINQMIGAK